jgi:hypothetical protein
MSLDEYLYKHDFESGLRVHRDTADEAEKKGERLTAFLIEHFPRISWELRSGKRLFRVWARYRIDTYEHVDLELSDEPDNEDIYLKKVGQHGIYRKDCASNAKEAKNILARWLPMKHEFHHPTVRYTHRCEACGTNSVFDVEGVGPIEGECVKCGKAFEGEATVAA